MSDSANMRTDPLKEPVEIFAGFDHRPLPDVIDALLFRVRAKDDPSGLERYAFRTLSAIDIDRLRALTRDARVSFFCAEHPKSLRLGFDRSRIDSADLSFLLGVESAMNRMLFVLKHLGFALAPATSSPSAEDCSLIEQDALSAVSAQVGRLLAEAVKPNSWMKIGSGLAVPDGEWDVRTRLAASCESLDLVERLDYGFFHDADAGIMRIGCTAPNFEAMPRCVYAPATSAWGELACADRRAMAREYTCRMALVLAAAGFGAGLAIRRCVVELCDLAPSRASIRLSFDRTEFMGLYADRADELVGEPLEGQAERLLSDAPARARARSSPSRRCSCHRPAMATEGCPPRSERCCSPTPSASSRSSRSSITSMASAPRSCVRWRLGTAIWPRAG